MDYFRKYLGNDELDDNESGIETIEKLVDRLTTVTLLEDRRDALRAIKSLSKKFRLEVGTQAMIPILNILELDKDDSETVFYALETLYNIMNEDCERDEIETNRLVNIPTGLGNQFTEMFINKPSNLELVLQFVEDTDFSVRRISMQLIHICLVNIQKETQEAILKCPMAISKFVDLLSDSNEVIRNDCLLLLIDLVKSNCNIQKIVAFENAYDHLLTIIKDEGDSDGGVIVEDCLKIIHALIENNPQNQTLFKENNYINRLAGFFEFADDSSANSSQNDNNDKGWSPQKLANVQLMLQIIRCLVSPHNKSQATSQCQTIILKCGLFERLCQILLGSGIPPQLLTETILTVAESMRALQASQDLFVNLMAQSEPPQPAVNVLLLSMVNEGQSFILRCAALYCFQCFLYKNPSGQQYIVQTLLPKSQKGPTDNYSPGKLLCMGLFSNQPLSIWFAAVSLMHCINNNSNLKEELLKVQLASSANSKAPISFLQKCCLLLNEGIRPQAKVGILMLLCTWLVNCPNAVSRFLPQTLESMSSRSSSRQGSPGTSNDGINSAEHSNNLLILLSQLVGVDNEENEIIVRGLCALIIGICVRFNTANTMDRRMILQTVERRLDKDILIDHINHLTKTEAYTKTMRNLQPIFNKASDVSFDYEFTRLFRSLENEILDTIQNNDNDHSNSITNRNSSLFNEHEKVVLQYKDLIKTQDEELKKLRAESKKSYQEQKQLEIKLERLQEELQTTKDQCALLKVRKSPQNSSSTSLPALNEPTNNSASSFNIDENIQIQINQLKSENENIKLKNKEESEKFHSQIDEITKENENLNKELEKLKKELSVFLEKEEKWKEDRKQYEELVTEHDDLLLLMADQEDTIRDLKHRLGIEDSDNEEENTNETID